MSKDSQIQTVKRLADFLERVEGERVSIREEIRHAQKGRAGKIHNRLAFRVERVGWFMSGGQIYLTGDESEYWILPGDIISFEPAGNSAVIVEQLDDHIERTTHLQILPQQSG